MAEKKFSQLERSSPAPQLIGTPRLRGELGDGDSVLIGEQVPYDAQQSGNKQKGISSPINHQSFSEEPTTGLVFGIADIDIPLGNTTFDLESGFVKIARTDPTDGTEPQNGKFFYPGGTGLEVPASGKGDPAVAGGVAGNITWVWFEEDTVATPIEIEGVSYPIAKIFFSFPSDYFTPNVNRDGEIPPEDNRLRASRIKISWIKGLPVPPAVNADGIGAIVDETRFAANVQGMVFDLITAIGPVRNRGGQVSQASVGGMRLDIAEAEWHTKGTGSAETPNTRRLPRRDNLPIGLFFATGDGQFLVNAIGPNSDVRSDFYAPGGVLTAIPSGKWALQTIWVNSATDTGGTRMQYGQDVYDTQWEAYAAVGKYLHSQVYPLPLAGQAMIAIVAVKEGATDLGDNSEAMIFNRHFHTQAWHLTSGPPPRPSGVSLRVPAFATPTTSDPTTNSSSFSTLEEMSIVVTPEQIGSRMEFHFQGSLSSTSTASLFLQLHVDGSPVGLEVEQATVPSETYAICLAYRHYITTSLTPITVTLEWRISTGTATAVGLIRGLDVLEISSL